MQNRIHYFRWTAGIIVVTNSFLTGTKNDKYGTYLLSKKGGKYTTARVLLESFCEMQRNRVGLNNRFDYLSKSEKQFVYIKICLWNPRLLIYVNEANGNNFALRLY